MKERTRLAVACKLLHDGNIPIGAIAAKCGYSSESVLKTRFKRQLGMTMSA